MKQAAEIYEFPFRIELELIGKYFSKKHQMRNYEASFFLKTDPTNAFCCIAL